MLLLTFLQNGRQGYMRKQTLFFFIFMSVLLSFFPGSKYCSWITIAGGLPWCLSKLCVHVRDCACVEWQQHSAGDIMVRNIQLRHAGKYTCAVQTKVDSISIAVDLVVRGNVHFTFFSTVNDSVPNPYWPYTSDYQCLKVQISSIMYHSFTVEEQAVC